MTCFTKRNTTERPEVHEPAQTKERHASAELQEEIVKAVGRNEFLTAVVPMVVMPVRIVMPVRMAMPVRIAMPVRMALPVRIAMPVLVSFIRRFIG